MKGTKGKLGKKQNTKPKEVLRNEKGITLIALVITIIILIILATVTLNVVLGEGGLIDRAQQAKDLTEQAALEEQQGLNSLMSEMANIMAEDQTIPEPPEEEEPPTPPEPEMPTIEDAKPNPNEDGSKFEDTTTIKDDLENEVTIPGGFHLDKDSGTKVEEGIVIEDDSGNQFVWIPVGEYNVSTSISSIGKLTNELNRRGWADRNVVAEPTPANGDSAIEDYYYGEGSTEYTSVAKEQIDAFKSSATANKGFYIGRYEAGTETERTAKTDPLTTPLVQANKYPYVYVTRDQAKTQAEAMHNGNEFVTSELISSYAWDTALNFICQTNKEGYLLATTTDKNYGNIYTGNKTQTGSYMVNGEEVDKYSNISDLLGNCREWTTEYSSCTGLGYSYDCVYRGGYYLNSGSLYCAAFRNYSHTNSSYIDYSFRIQLYINPTN